VDIQLQIIDVRAAEVVQLSFEREWLHLTDVSHSLPVLDDIRVKSPTNKHPRELKSVCQKVPVYGRDHD